MQPTENLEEMQTKSKADPLQLQRQSPIRQVSGDPDGLPQLISSSENVDESSLIHEGNVVPNKVKHDRQGYLVPQLSFEQIGEYTILELIERISMKRHNLIQNTDQLLGTESGLYVGHLNGCRQSVIEDKIVFQPPHQNYTNKNKRVLNKSVRAPTIQTQTTSKISEEPIQSIKFCNLSKRKKFTNMPKRLLRVLKEALKQRVANQKKSQKKRLLLLKKSLRKIQRKLCSSVGLKQMREIFDSPTNGKVSEMFRRLTKNQLSSSTVEDVYLNTNIPMNNRFSYHLFYKVMQWRMRVCNGELSRRIQCFSQ